MESCGNWSTAYRLLFDIWRFVVHTKYLLEASEKNNTTQHKRKWENNILCQSTNVLRLEPKFAARISTEISNLAHRIYLLMYNVFDVNVLSVSADQFCVCSSCTVRSWVNDITSEMFSFLAKFNDIIGARVLVWSMVASIAWSIRKHWNRSFVSCNKYKKKNVWMIPTTYRRNVNKFPMN